MPLTFINISIPVKENQFIIDKTVSKVTSLLCEYASMKL